MPRVSLGIEYNPLADEVGPLANVVAVREGRTRPALIFGTSSDRIGTPDGQAYFGTFSKDLEELTGVPVAPYAGLTYGTYEDELRVIGGFRARLGRGFSTTFIWDGVNLHPTLEYSWRRHVLTFLWVDLENPGVAYSLEF